jgi:hypothetical protein
MENHENSHYLGQDLSLEYPKYKVEMLTTTFSYFHRTVHCVTLLMLAEEYEC